MSKFSKFVRMSAGVSVFVSTVLASYVAAKPVPILDKLTEHERKRIFNEKAPKYDELVGPGESSFMYNIEDLRKEVGNIFAKAALQKQKSNTTDNTSTNDLKRLKVLELGAGTGRQLPYYNLDNMDVVLFDFSDEMLSVAASRAKQAGYSKDHLQIVIGDAHNVQQVFPKETFDYIVSTFTLCSMNDPVQVLKNTKEVLKKDNSKLILLEHGRATWDFVNWFLHKYSSLHEHEWGCQWDRDPLEICKQAGLVVEKVERHHLGTSWVIICRP